MAYIILLLLIINTSISITTFFKRKIEETFFLSIFSYTFIIYLMGVIFNSLNIGFYLIIFFNILLLIYNVFGFIKKKINFKQQFFTVGFFLFLISFCFILWISIGRKCTEWDEFSHWVLVVKNMNSLGNFGLGSESTVMVKSYLSGTSLFQYFCTKLSPEFNESLCFVGMNLTLMSLIVPAFKNIKKNNKFLAFLLFGTLLFIPIVFYYNIYTSLYVDAILAVTFAYAIYSYFSNYEEGLSRFQLINIACSLCMLILIKDFGLLFACGVFVVILIDNLFIRDKFRFNFKYIWDKTKFLFLTLVPMILVKFTWMMILKSISSDSSSTSSILSGFENIFTGNLLPHQPETIRLYMEALYSKSLSNVISLNLSFSICMCIAIGLAYIIISNVKNKGLKKAFSVTLFLTILGAILYAIVLLFVPYLTLFSEYEALRLASYSRYMNSYIFGLLFMELCMIIKVLSPYKKRFGNFIIILFILLAFNINHAYIINLTFNARQQVKSTQESRSNFDTLVKIKNEHLKGADSIYFVATNTVGAEFYIAKYELTPNKINQDNFGWSIGVPYYEGDIWTKNISCEQWREDLKENYDYVYLYMVDDQFIDLYGKLFNSKEIQNNQLYKVNKDVKNEELLTLVSAEI